MVGLKNKILRKLYITGRLMRNKGKERKDGKEERRKGVGAQQTVGRPVTTRRSKRLQYNSVCEEGGGNEIQVCVRVYEVMRSTSGEEVKRGKINSVERMSVEEQHCGAMPTHTHIDTTSFLPSTHTHT